MSKVNHKPLRLALCVTDLSVGGAERCLVELATRLERERFTPVVYCLAPRPAAGADALVQQLAAAGVEMHFLDASSSSQFPSVVRRLAGLFRAQRPDVVQAFLVHANVVAALAARWAGAPRMLTGIRVAERDQRWHLWGARVTSPLVDWQVCVSQAVADFSRSVGRLPEQKLVVIPNGIDVQRIAGAVPCNLASLGIAPGRRVISCIGRLERQKGLDWLLELAPAIFARLPEHDLLLVGEGAEREKLERQTAELQLTGRVHFAGWRPDVAEILAASELLVLPSRWEGMPNVVLEAMAAGRPVMAAAVEGVAELLGPAAEQQTTSLGDAQVFTDKLVSLAGDAALRARLGNENCLRAREFFSLQAMVGAYARLYESLR